VVLTSSGLDGQVFAGAPYAFSHLDYPILLPLFESVYFRAMGGVDAQAVHAVLWILYVATLGALAYLGSRFTRVWVWLPVVLALALGGQFYTQLLTAYADVPMGLLAVPGVLCLGLWLRDLDWRYLTLGALLLAAAASVKNEGLLLMLACFVAAAIVLAVARSWRTLGRLGIGFAGVLAALAPWQIWVKAHDIKGNLPVGKGLDPGYLSDHSDRVSPTVKALLPMLESGGLSYVIPLGLAIALLGLATRGLRPVSAFYLLAALGTFASVVWAFVISPDTIEYQIATSANRVIMGVAFVALAGLLHICGLLDGHRTVAADEHDADTAVHEPPPPSESAVRARDTAPA
jgi:4-amino-4-deoxy-L-arabinose transferase-like glycosyltransferase